MIPPSTINLGVIGRGKWGARVIDCIQSMERAGIPIHCRWAMDQGGKHHFDTGPVEGVVIATPPKSHADLAYHYLIEGKGVLVEKPFTASLDDANWLYRATTHVPNHMKMVGHIQLFNPAYRELKKRVMAEGGPQVIYAVDGNSGPLRPDVSALWDYGPHMLGLAMDLAGSYPQTQVSCCSPPTPDGRRNYSILLGFPNFLARIQLGNARPTKARWLTVTTREHNYVFDDLHEHKLQVGPPSGVEGSTAKGWQPVKVDATAPLVYEMITFINGVQGKWDERLGFGLGLDTVRLLTEIDRQQVQEGAK